MVNPLNLQPSNLQLLDSRRFVQENRYLLSLNIMHEWALAESVIKTIKSGKNIKKGSPVEVLFGELQDIDREIFSFALDELLKQEPELKKTRIKIETEKAEFECVSCGAKFDLKAAVNTPEEKENIHFIPEMAKAFIKCPKCRSHDFEITKGRGLSLRVTGNGEKCRKH